MSSEFSIIDHYFSRESKTHDRHLTLGIGDDAALINPPQGYELAISVDTLISGHHFPENTSASDIGYKSLVVNLSDMAAMGATPRWVTLSISLPEDDPKWLSDFSTQFFAVADQFGVALIGGDTVKGPLAITVQIIGTVKSGLALKRSDAKAGDLIVISGSLGDAGAGLKIALQQKHAVSEQEQALIDRLNRPAPRVELGQQLLSLASSAIDISDGLVSDLGHILKCSGVGARIDAKRLPLSDALASYCSEADAQQLALSAGDDYELCFTLPPENQSMLEQISKTCGIALTTIGEITAEDGLMIENNLNPLHAQSGFDHFRDVES